MLEVPLEGVIVLRGTRYDDGELGEVVVHDSEGVAVPGAVAVRDLAPTELTGGGLGGGYGAPTEVTPVLVIWRAASSLTAGASYRVEVAGFGSSVTTVDVVAASEPFGGLVEAPAAVFAARMDRYRPSLGATCGPDPHTGSCATCNYISPEVVGGILEATLPETFTDRTVLHRLVSDAADVNTRRDTAWAGDRPAAALMFDGEASELCGHLESESLIDGSTVVGPRTCLAPTPLADPDGGMPDAGMTDGGMPDASMTDGGSGTGGCSVSSGDAPAGALLVMLAMAAVLRRSCRKVLAP